MRRIIVCVLGLMLVSVAVMGEDVSERRLQNATYRADNGYDEGKVAVSIETGTIKYVGSINDLI